MTTGDVRVLIAWVALWLVATRVERWWWTRRMARSTPTPEALASQARFHRRLELLRAEHVQADPPKPVGLRLTGTDAMIVDQLITLTRGHEPRRSTW